MAIAALSEADHERTIAARVGDELAVTLPESPTTGYVWTHHAVTGCVRLVRDVFELTATSDRVGGGGRHTFTIAVATAGDGAVELKLWRPWAGEASVEQRFRVRIAATA